MEKKPQVKVNDNGVPELHSSNERMQELFNQVNSIMNEIGSANDFKLQDANEYLEKLLNILPPQSRPMVRIMFDSMMQKLQSTTTSRNEPISVADSIATIESMSDVMYEQHQNGVLNVDDVLKPMFDMFGTNTQPVNITIQLPLTDAQLTNNFNHPNIPPD
jgi:paraquat-inducible protein B